MASGATSVASSAAPRSESPVRLSTFASLSSSLRSANAGSLGSDGQAMLVRGTGRFREQADLHYSSSSAASYRSANPIEDSTGGTPPPKSKDNAATLSSLSAAAAMTDRRTPPASEAPLRTVSSVNGSTNGHEFQVNPRSSSASSASRDRWRSSEGGPGDGGASERDNGSERGVGGSNHSDSGARDGGSPPEDNESRITVNGQEIYADDLIGLRVAKAFEGHGRFLGQVVKFEEASQLYTVVYADGDAEEISIENTIEILIQPEIEQADPIIAPSTMDSLPEPEVHRVAQEVNNDLPPPPPPKPLPQQQHTHQRQQQPQAYSRPQTQSPPRRRTIQISEREAQFVIGLFENHALPALLRMGWRVEMSGSGIGKRFVAPPGSRRDRVRIFSSVMDVVEYIASDEELLSTCFPSSVHSAIVSLFPENEQPPEGQKQVMQRSSGLEELDGRPTRLSRYEMQQPRGLFMRSSAAIPVKRGYRLEETAGLKRAHDGSEARDMSPTTQAKYSRYTYPSSTQSGYLSSKDLSVVRRFHPDAYEPHQRMTSQSMHSKWSSLNPSDYRQSYAYSDRLDRDMVAPDRSDVPGPNSRGHISQPDGPPLYRHERAMTRPSGRTEEVGAHRYSEPVMAAGLTAHEPSHFQPYQRRPRSPMGDTVHVPRSAAPYRTRPIESVDQDPRALTQGGANRSFSMRDVDQTYSHPAAAVSASSKPLMPHAMPQSVRREGNIAVRDQPRYEDQRHYAPQRVDRHSFAPRSEMYRMQQHQQYAYDRRHPDSAHTGPDHPRASAERGRGSADGEHVI